MPADSSRPDRRAPSVRSKTSGGAGKARAGAPKGRPGGGGAARGRSGGRGAGSSGRSGAPTGRSSRSDSSGTRRPSRAGASRRDEEEELKSGTRPRRSSTGTRNPRGSTGSRTGSGGSGDRTGTGRRARSSSGSGRPPRREGASYSSDRPSRTAGRGRAGSTARPARPGAAGHDSGAGRGGRPPYRAQPGRRWVECPGRVVVPLLQRRATSPRRIARGASPHPERRPEVPPTLLPSLRRRSAARRGQEVGQRRPAGRPRGHGAQRRRRTADGSILRRPGTAPDGPPPRPEPWVRVDGSPDEWEDTPPRGRGRGGAKAAPGAGRSPTRQVERQYDRRLHPVLAQGATARDRGGDPQCRQRGHRPPPGAPGREGGIGLWSL